MVGAITLGQWQASRDALRRAGDRFLALVESVPYPKQTMATAEWTVADMAAHVRTIASLYTSILQPDRIPHPFPEAEPKIATVTVDTVAEMNEVILRRYKERDTHVVNTLLASEIDNILSSTKDADPATPIPWLGGSRVPVGGILAHLTNELLIHGWDIARATDSRWNIPPQDAALFFELFLVGMLRNYAGDLLGPQIPGRRIAVEFRSPHTTPVTLVLENRRVTLEEPGHADARLTFDPTTLNLVLFGRVSKARAALTGKIKVSGPRLWRLPEFLRIVHLPDNSYPKGTPPT